MVSPAGLRRLLGHRSVRRFTDRELPDEVIIELIELARLTGSARNGQPWRFVAVREPGLRGELGGLGAYAEHLRVAPVVLVVLGPENRAIDTEFDLGRVIQSVTLAATHLGLGHCVTSLYPEANATRAAALVGAPAGWSAAHAVALGHPLPVDESGRSAIPTGRLDTSKLLRFC